MADPTDQPDHHRLRGASDRPALLTIRDIVEEMEPLATAGLDDYLDPAVVEVTLNDGLCEADSARIDIRWTTRGDYAFHYTDSGGVNARWGKHPHGGEYRRADGLEHHHPPPDASSDPDEVQESCITQSSEALVTRAVLKLWRVAYHTDAYTPLNAGSNPP